MKIGKAEITEFTITVIMVVFFGVSIAIICGKIDIEKEKTEQLKVELEIEQQRNEKGRL